MNWEKFHRHSTCARPVNNDGSSETVTEGVTVHKNASIHPSPRQRTNVVVVIRRLQSGTQAPRRLIRSYISFPTHSTGFRKSDDTSPAYIGQPRISFPFLLSVHSIPCRPFSSTAVIPTYQSECRPPSGTPLISLGHPLSAAQKGPDNSAGQQTPYQGISSNNSSITSTL